MIVFGVRVRASCFDKNLRIIAVVPLSPGMNIRGATFWSACSRVFLSGIGFNNNSNVGRTAGLTKVSQDGENAHEFIWRLK